MKLLSLFVAFAFTANVMAATAPVQELERTLDNYQYSMTVEWNQKDQAFYQEKTEAFFAELGTLMNNGSVTQADLMKVLEKKVTDKKQIEAIKAKLSGISANSNAELAKVLSQNIDQMYSRGASWNGEVLTIGLGVLVVGALAYAIIWSLTHKCVAYEQAYVCNSYGTNYGGYYGGGYYNGYYGGGYTYCGYQDVCTDYEKK